MYENRNPDYESQWRFDLLFVIFYSKRYNVDTAFETFYHAHTHARKNHEFTGHALSGLRGNEVNVPRAFPTSDTETLHSPSCTSRLSWLPTIRRCNTICSWRDEVFIRSRCHTVTKCLLATGAEALLLARQHLHDTL